MPSLFRSGFFVAALALSTTAGVTTCSETVSGSLSAIDSVVHSVAVSPSSDSVAVRGRVTLVAAVDVSPAIADRTVKWSSSDPSVASVDTAGVVTGVAVGTATILAASNANPQVTGRAVVTVTAAP